jgi:hypothetical protein
MKARRRHVADAHHLTLLDRGTCAKQERGCSPFSYQAGFPPHRALGLFCEINLKKPAMSDTTQKEMIAEI